MYRMMIVDDQMKEIEGIRDLLYWEKIDIQIVGHATNGEDGLNEALRLKPDIIVTDIVMPIMDGLEMIQRIKQQLPNMKVIFISCFDDFKFVSRAINQGAYGYVLKPILPGELLSAIHKTLGVCEEEKKGLELVMLRQKINESITSLQEHFFRNLLFGVFGSEADIVEQSRFLELEVENMHYSAVNIDLECAEDAKIFFHGVTITEKLKHNFQGQNGIYFILIDLSHLALLFMDSHPNPLQCKKLFSQRVQDILDYINSEYEITATAGMGCITRSLGGISLSYKQAKEALQYKFFLGKQRVIDTEEVSFQFNSMDPNLDNLNDVLKQILFSSDKQLVEAFITSRLTNRHTPYMLKYICHTVFNSVQLLLTQMQHNPESILGPYSRMIEQVSTLDNLSELKRFMISKLTAVIDYLQNFNKMENKSIVTKMEEFILEHFHEPILIEDVAGHVYLSAGYANYIFKNITGKTMHQYIEDMRLEKATELLLGQKEMKVYRVSEKVGYNNSAHFINVFKKVFGCTPSEYRKRHIV